MTIIRFILPYSDIIFVYLCYIRNVTFVTYLIFIKYIKCILIYWTLRKICSILSLHSDVPYALRVARVLQRKVWGSYHSSWLCQQPTTIYNVKYREFD